MQLVKIARDGKMLGDFEYAQIGRLVRLGSIRPSDHYWMEGMAGWEVVLSRQWPEVGASTVPSAATPNWYRSSDSRLLAGVCGGLAHKWGRPAWLVRLVFFLFLPFAVFFIYPVLWLSLREVHTASLHLGGAASPAKPMPFLAKAVLVLMGVGVFAGIISGAGGSGSRGSSGDGVGLAYKRAQVMVRNSLKSPSSAEFPGIIKDNADIQYECYLGKEHSLEIVSAWVDAQNSFGAKLRQRWTAAYIVGKDSNGEFCLPAYLELGGSVVLGSRSKLNSAIEAGRTGRLSEWLTEDAPKK